MSENGRIGNEWRWGAAKIGRIGDDLLWGAPAIGDECLNEPDKKKRDRKAYYLLENGYIDAEKMGNIWVASRRGCGPDSPATTRRSTHDNPSERTERAIWRRLEGDGPSLASKRWRTDPAGAWAARRAGGLVIFNTASAFPILQNIADGK